MNTDIDLQAVRALVAHHLVTRRDDKSKVDDSEAAFPGDHAIALIGLDRTLDAAQDGGYSAREDGPTSVDEELAYRIPMFFNEGIECGIALAVAIIDQPFAPSDAQINDALAAAKSKAADLVKSALRDASRTSLKSLAVK